MKLHIRVDPKRVKEEGKFQLNLIRESYLGIISTQQVFEIISSFVSISTSVIANK